MPLFVIGGAGFVGSNFVMDLLALLQRQSEAVVTLIVNALAGKALQGCGDGRLVDDLLYKSDHCSAIRAVLSGGRLGEVYSIGGWNETPNMEIVNPARLAHLWRLAGRETGVSLTVRLN